MTKVSEHVYVSDNGMNTVIIHKNNSACLINWNGGTGPGLLATLGAKLKMIICLNYRASANGGAADYLGAGAATLGAGAATQNAGAAALGAGAAAQVAGAAAQVAGAAAQEASIAACGTLVAAPEAHRGLFESPADWLAAEKNRLRLFRLLRPDNDILSGPVRVDMPLRSGQTLDFEGIRLEFAESPGYTEGELFCVIHDDIKVGVCGDHICAGGKIPFLHRLDAGQGESGQVSDYHAFMLRADEFRESLDAFLGCGALIPARGAVITDVSGTAGALKDRLARLYRNYASASALNFYFPGLLAPENAITPARHAPLPDNVIYINTSFLLISGRGRGFLIDCGNRETVRALLEMREKGQIAAVDACFITHYHFDHIDALDELRKHFGAKIYATESESDVIRNPEGYYLPCLSDMGFANEILPDGGSFRWEEYTLTAFEFPGQTLHHGALLAGGGKDRILFCGDSFSPSGFDDYCMQNRCLGGEGRGFRKCLDIVAREKPGMIINSHQHRPFVFAEYETGPLRQKLDERDAILDELSPWPAADFSLDPYWARIYPYVTKTKTRGPLELELQITSHFAGLAVALELAAPGGRVSPAKFELTLPPPTCGYKSAAPGGDICVPFTFYPEDDQRVQIIGVKVWLNGAYFGEACKGVVIYE